MKSRFIKKIYNKSLTKNGIKIVIENDKNGSPVF